MEHTQTRIEDLAPGSLFWMQMPDDRFDSECQGEEIVRAGDLYQFRAGTEGLKHCSTVVYRTAGGLEIVRWCDVPDDPGCEINPWLEGLPGDSLGETPGARENILGVAVGRLTARASTSIDHWQPGEEERAATIERWKRTIATPFVESTAPAPPAETEG